MVKAEAETESPVSKTRLLFKDSKTISISEFRINFSMASSLHKLIMNFRATVLTLGWFSEDKHSKTVT